MLHFLTGAAYSGKTKALFTLTRTLCAAERRVFFFVPEQQTAATEADLLAFCGNRAGEYLEVLNFQRLPNRIFREIGGVAQTGVSPTEKALLVARILQEEADQLSYYAKNRLSSDFVRTLVSFFDELLRGGETAESLAALAENETLSREVNLKKKLSDIAHLYSRYQVLYRDVYESYADEQMRLAEAFSEPETGEFFRGATVIVDGFYDFTAPQYELICHMLHFADDVYLSLLDSEADDPLFSRPRAAKALLTSRLKPAEHRTVTPEELGIPARESEIPADLSFLCDHIIKNPETLFDEIPERIEVTACRAAYDEVAEVMRALCRLFDEGVPPADCAILYRDSALYAPLVRELADQYAIPLYTDDSVALADRPLAHFFLTAARLAVGKASGEDFLALLGSDLCPLSHETALYWGRYVKTWNLSGEKLTSPDPYTACAFGFTELRFQSQKEENDHILDSINREKGTLCRALIRLRTSFSRAADCRARVEALFTFAEDCRLAETLSNRIDALRDTGRFSDAAIETGLFEACRTAMEALSATPGAVSQSTFLELLTLAFSYAKIGALPSSPAALAAGDVSFTRLKKVRHLFFVGLNADIFPSATPPSLLLSARERSLLADLRTEDPLFFAQHTDAASLDEHFLFYLACAIPSEKLHLSYHRQTLSGDNAGESVFLSRVRHLFPKLTVTAPEENAMPVVFSELYQYLVEMRDADDDFTKKARSLFPLFSDCKPLFSKEEEAERRDTLPAEQGANLSLSQAKLESYAKCPYQYFLKYALNLQEKQRAETDASFCGTMVHEVLEHLLGAAVRAEKENGKNFFSELASIDEAQVKAEFKNQRQLLLDRGYELTPSDEALLEDLSSSTVSLLDSIREELSVGTNTFKPELFEATLEGDLSPLVLSLSGGGSVKVKGTADRIDLYRDGKDTYARVIDYKSSGKEFDPEKVLNGLETQLLLYLVTLSENGIPRKGKPGQKAAPNEKILPAGAYYMQAILNPRAASEAEEKALTEGSAPTSCSFSRQGLFVNVPSALDAMLPSADVNVNDPTFAVKRAEKTDKKTKTTYTEYGAKKGVMVTPDEYDKIRTHVLNHIQKTAEDILAGDIRRAPLWESNRESVRGCKYCPYLAICRYEELSPCRTMAKTDKKSLIDDLTKGGIHRG